MHGREIVEHMLANDIFSQWLGLELIASEPGRCELTCTVRNEMLNGHLIGHGGITYSISDSALAFASNAHGNRCVSIETSISHIRPVKEGDRLQAVCEEVSRGKSIATYISTVTNQENKVVSRFKGTVHISEETW